MKWTLRALIPATVLRRAAIAIVVAGACLLTSYSLAGTVADKHPELDKLKAARENNPASVDFKRMELGSAFDVLSRVAGFHVTFGEHFPKEKEVTYDITNMPLKELLAKLAEDHRLIYEVATEDTLIVKGATTEF